jgi:hypothetical protein
MGFACFIERRPIRMSLTSQNCVIRSCLPWGVICGQADTILADCLAVADTETSRKAFGRVSN